MFAGYTLALAVGIPAGVTIGTVRRVQIAVAPVLEFFRALPVTTLYPLFVLLFGIGHLSKVAMVFAASVWVIMLNAAYGVSNSPPDRRQMAKLFGGTGWQVFWCVTTPNALPQIFIGMRVAMSYSLIVAIVCEMFMGSQYGLGQRVFEAYNRYASADLYALVLITGTVGILLNAALASLEKHVLYWKAR